MPTPLTSRPEEGGEALEEAELSPLPWRAGKYVGEYEGMEEDEEEVIFYWVSHAKTVCATTTVCNVFNETDARLIAAAPDLLEAAKAAEQCIVDFLEVYKNGGSMLVMDEAVKSLRGDALKAVRAAMSKAGGQS